MHWIYFSIWKEGLHESLASAFTVTSCLCAGLELLSVCLNRWIMLVHKGPNTAICFKLSTEFRGFPCSGCCFEILIIKQIISTKKGNIVDAVGSHNDSSSCLLFIRFCFVIFIFTCFWCKVVCSNVLNLVGIAAKNILLCTVCDITGWWGTLGQHFVHLSSLSCVACWERAALYVVSLLCSGPERLLR